MVKVTLENVNQNIIKSVLLLFFLLMVAVLIKKYLTKENIRRLEAYKTIFVVAFSIIVFLGGLYYVGKDGNIYYVAFYPLYVSIIVASLGAVKYRSLEIDSIPLKYLIKELKWGTSFAVFLLFLLIIINMSKILDTSINMVFNLLFLGYLFNLALIYSAYRKKKNIK